MFAPEREEEGLSLGLWTNERTLLFFYTVFDPFITKPKREDMWLERYHQEGRPVGLEAVYVKKDDVDKHSHVHPF